MRIFALLTLVTVVWVSPTLAYAAPTRFLVKFKPELSSRDIGQVLERSGLIEMRSFSEIGVRVVEVRDRGAFEQSALQRNPSILYIEKSFKVQALVEPNDKKYKSQDQLKRTHIEKAWDLTTGSKEVIIAVSDTGAELSHKDLKANIYKNPKEIPGNKIDDDSNGYVDDVSGWDFLWDTNNADDSGLHGTHVSGIIGAEGNNKNGIAGINWNVSIMPVKFLGSDGGTLEDGIASLLYAVNNGARVINCSWGGQGESQAMADAVQYVYEHGALIVAAAGNRGWSNDGSHFTPATVRSPGLIAVASSDTNGKLSDFSNYGVMAVPLAAPGSAVLSTVTGDSYSKLSGTSMAAPFVSGIAGLILSVAPELSVKDLKNAVLNAVDERKGYLARLSTGGDINAHKAVAQLSKGFQVWPSRMTVAPGQTHGFTAYKPQGKVSWSVTPDNLGTIDQNGLFTAAELAQGVATVTATDESGATASTTWVRVSAPSLACGQSPTQGGSNDLGLMMSFALPFVTAFAVTRRRRRI
jgi:thermitase